MVQIQVIKAISTEIGPHFGYIYNGMIDIYANLNLFLFFQVPLDAT